MMACNCAVEQATKMVGLSFIDDDNDDGDWDDPGEELVFVSMKVYLTTTLCVLTTLRYRLVLTLKVESEKANGSIAAGRIVLCKDSSLSKSRTMAVVCF